MTVSIYNRRYTDVKERTSDYVSNTIYGLDIATKNITKLSDYLKNKEYDSAYNMIYDNIISDINSLTIIATGDKQTKLTEELVAFYGLAMKQLQMIRLSEKASIDVVDNILEMFHGMRKNFAELRKSSNKSHQEDNCADIGDIV